MQIMIEVSGGVVCSVTATDEVSIYLIDHDNIKEKGEDIAHALEAMQPDCICNSEAEFMEKLDESLSEYRG